MAWKSKEKDISPEEALAQTKKDLAPFWHGSVPLLAGVKTKAGVSAIPLEPDFLQKNWLLYFMDPTDASGEVGLVYLKEFQRRFGSHAINMILIFRSSFGFIREKATLESMVRKHQITCPIVTDSDGHLFAAFAAEALPKLLLLSAGKVIFAVSETKNFGEAELAIHHFLRITDPGLPLWPVYKPVQKLWRDVGRIDFGRIAGLQFPAPGFGGAQAAAAAIANTPAKNLKKSMAATSQVKEPPPILTARFSDTPMARTGTIGIAGEWSQDDDRIFTSDPTARLEFSSLGSAVNLVAQAIKVHPGESPRFVLELDGAVVRESLCGSDLGPDDEGRSTIITDSPRVYSALVGLPAGSRKVTLRFPHAGKAPTAIYGIRFLEPIE